MKRFLKLTGEEQSRSTPRKRGELNISESQITRIYAALGNPYRRKIVDLLKTRGRLGFKELHEGLGISVGALYHHLEMLEGVVGQDSDKKYVLTDQGRSAVKTLSVGLFHRKGAELSLLNGTAFAMLPLLIVPCILYISRSVGLSLSSELGVLTFLPILIQAWIICLLSASISISKGLRMEKTAVISLGIMYVNILAVILALQPLVF